MSLIVYECQRTGHGHEIRQFSSAAQSLYDYFDARDETALFISNVNAGEANLDGHFKVSTTNPTSNVSKND